MLNGEHGVIILSEDHHRAAQKDKRIGQKNRSLIFATHW